MFAKPLISRKLVIFFNGALVLFISALAANTSQAQRPLGIDVYAGNGVITWTTVKSGGISFAWAKATEGNYYIDTNFVNNQVNGKAAGVYMGAYDFSRPDLLSPTTEANYFWNTAKNYVKNDGKTLMPMLDYETFPGTVVGASTYADWAKLWCSNIVSLASAQGVSVTPVIYISTCNTTELGSENSSTIPWLANYNNQSANTGTPWGGVSCTENEIWGSGVWNVWQFTSSVTISGVPGTYSSGLCDEDVFNGTSNQLVLSLLAGSIAVTSAPTNTTVPLGSNATFHVTALTSGNPLTYQWKFNQINVPGAITNFYTITNAQLTNAGAYTVMVTNSNGSILTSPAYLSVLAPLINAPNSALDPSNMINWWTADGNFNDIYGVTNLSPNGGLSYTNGEVGLAYRFDGSSAYMTSSGGEIAPPWTICGWIYHQRAPTASAALAGDKTYALKVEQWSNTDEVGISHSGVADYLFSPAYTLPLNTWTHVAFVASSSTVTLYANGVQKGTVSATGFDLPRGFFGVDTFSGSPSDYLSGAVDELQIYTNALTASQISSIFNAGSAGLVRAPQFTSITNLNNGQITLNLIGQTGKPITVRSSPDLINWSTAGTVQNNTGATNYTDTAAPGQKFYQATQKF